MRRPGLRRRRDHEQRRRLAAAEVAARPSPARSAASGPAGEGPVSLLEGRRHRRPDLARAPHVCLNDWSPLTSPACAMQPGAGAAPPGRRRSRSPPPGRNGQIRRPPSRRGERLRWAFPRTWIRSIRAAALAVLAGDRADLRARRGDHRADREPVRAGPRRQARRSPRRGRTRSSRSRAAAAPTSRSRPGAGGAAYPPARRGLSRSSPTSIFSPSEGQAEGTATAVAQSHWISILGPRRRSGPPCQGRVDCTQPPRPPNVPPVGSRSR